MKKKFFRYLDAFNSCSWFIIACIILGIFVHSYSTYYDYSHNEFTVNLPIEKKVE